MYPPTTNSLRSSFHILRRLGGARLDNSPEVDLPSMSDNMRIRLFESFAPSRSALVVLRKTLFVCIISVLLDSKNHACYIGAYDTRFAP